MSSDIFNNMQLISQPVTQPQKQQAVSSPVTVKDAIPSSGVTNQESDTVELQTQPKQKKGIIRKVKDTIANIKKFCAATKEYTKGVFKGVFAGAVAGSVVYTAGDIFNAVKKKAAEKAETQAKRMPNKALAVLVGVAALGINIWTASLNATEAKSNIDHRWTGHKQ